MTKEYNVTPQLPSNGFTVAELFAGGGLMAVGLKAAGYNIVWANDFDKNVVKAYKANLGDYIVHGDITAIDPNDIPDVDIIAGGPPCQDYSVAGTGAGERGERGKLVWAYLDIIQRKQPKAFIFENVKGLVGKKHKHTFEALLTKFNEIGYNVSHRVVNAWDYGVAQKRERVFIVGIRKDIGFTFEFPEPKPEDYRTQVLRDVIGDLPEPNDGTNGYIQTQATTVKESNKLSFQRQYVADWEKPARTVNTNRLDHAEIHPGPMNHVGKYLGDYEGFESRTRRRSMDDASYTVDTRWDINYVHPTQPRRFTVRECLRIQSVPDMYVFPEDMSLSAMYRVVGNGVASRVAYLLGIALAEQLSEVLTKSNEKSA